MMVRTDYIEAKLLFLGVILIVIIIKIVVYFLKYANVILIRGFENGSSRTILRHDSVAL